MNLPDIQINPADLAAMWRQVYANVGEMIDSKIRDALAGTISASRLRGAINATQLQGRAIDPAAPDGGDALLWDAASSSYKPAAAGGGGGTVTVVTTMVMGDASDPLTTGTDKNPIPMEASAGLTITEVRLKVRTAPVGAAIIVDIHKNGTTIFTDQANRPQIADGATEGNTTTIDVAGLVKGDDLTLDIDQVGSGTAGGVLMVEIICNQTVAVS